MSFLCQFVIYKEKKISFHVLFKLSSLYKLPLLSMEELKCKKYFVTTSIDKKGYRSGQVPKFYFFACQKLKLRHLLYIFDSKDKELLSYS